MRLAALILALCGTAGAHTLRIDRGRLELTTVPGESDRRLWQQTPDGLEFEDCDARGWFDGGVFVRTHPGVIEVGGRRQNFHDWEVIDFAVCQSAREVTAAYIVRTPITMPDVTFRFVEPDLTLLLIRHPELRPLLDEVLVEVGGSRFAFDPAVAAQVDPSARREPPGLAAAVAVLLPGLAAADWRDRERAAKALAGLGRDAAVYCLLRLDRDGLPAEVQRGIDELLAGWPVLTADDRRALAAAN